MILKIWKIAKFFKAANYLSIIVKMEIIIFNRLDIYFVDK